MFILGRSPVSFQNDRKKIVGGDAIYTCYTLDY